jgi:hypothetical protein
LKESYLSNNGVAIGYFVVPSTLGTSLVLGANILIRPITGDLALTIVFVLAYRVIIYSRFTDAAI